MDGIFHYVIESFRIDGDYSADPADYAHLPPDRVLGGGLYAFLRAELPAALTPKGLLTQPRPGAPGRGLSWDIESGYLVALRPTRRTLEQWQSVSALKLGCGGSFEATREPLRHPVDLDALIAEVTGRR